MFFEVEMRRVVVVEPRELGDAMHTKRAMIRRLLSDVDAEHCSEEHWYYVAVTTLEDVSEGKVRPGTGAVVFWVSFKCIVFKPIRNEVVEAEVTEVLSVGFLAGNPETSLSLLFFPCLP
jgi:DNA-directed RNA polymerase subunit E'/Rpb7